MDNIKKIFAEVIGIDENDVNDSVERDVTEGWDSFSHLMLINELEDKLNIKFTMEEVESIKTFADIKNIVSKKG